MNIKEQMKEFNESCRPFYLVDHDNGSFSLCLAFTFLDDDYGQEAFNAYATEVGELIQDEHGLYTYGNGYDWESAFKQAFKDDPKLKSIKFDCEAGGFFCDCNDLNVLSDFGHRFKALVDDTDAFKKVVSDGIRETKLQQEAFEKIEFKIKGRLVRHPDANFMIRTVQGDVRLTPKEIEGLLDGSKETLLVGGQHMKAEDFLMQDAYQIQRDLFDRNTYQVITNDAQALQEQEDSEDQAPAMEQMM